MIDPASGHDAGAAMVRVWDPLVRVFHWGLVAAFATAWLAADEVQPVHELAGYTVASLVVFRLVWGFAGSRHARFAQFVTGPAATLAYLGAMLRGRERRYLGHNPAGAAMILVLLLTLSGTAFTGWLMTDPARQARLPALPQTLAPAWADDDEDDYGEADGWQGDTDGPLRAAHETLANLTLLLVALHICGVVLASVRHRENLVRAMLTGDKRPAGPGDVA
ncbi:cytochrome b/b6 domain-containing protein [Tabrizicola caldifontis]|uniref:cytochrome b/b6 domain-containing protein n=1 Tax=Tabrizicola caldifontis TaxID=2528036 RepID=UPI001F0F0678|nr:cytochrome b/b6 domain-containing protein [Rhodobacter sp. YIM 73028]